MSYILTSLISFILFAFPIHCDTGFITHCANLFVQERDSLNNLKSSVLTSCNEFLKNKNLNETNGCVLCNERFTYNLYDLGVVDTKSDVMISVCMGSSNTCETNYSGDSAQLFDEFLATVNDQDKLKTLSSLDPLILSKFNTETDVAPSSQAITASIIKETEDSLTYKISSTLEYPVKCYKSLDTDKPEFPQGSLYYILKPKTTNRIFTEYFKSSDYDCQTYSLYLKCFSVPYQDNIKTFTEYKFFSIKHEMAGTSCQYSEGVQAEPEPEEEKPLEKENIPTLSTKDPKNDNSQEISEIQSKQPEKQLEAIKDITSNLKESTNDKFTDSMNSVIKANEIIGAVDCNQLEESSQQKSCNSTKEEIQKECWNNIESTISNKDTIADSLDPESEDFESNLKILYQTMITSFKNPETFDKDTKKKAMSLTSQTLQESLELLEKIDNNEHITDKDLVKKDLINLIAAAASSVLQLAHDESSKKEFISEKEQKQVRLSLKTVSRVLLDNDIEEKQLNNIEFKCKKNDEESNSDGLNIVYPNQGINVTIPTEYIKKKYDKDNIIGFCVNKYQNYPFITTKGTDTFYRHVIAVEAISGDEDYNVVKVEKLEKDNQLTISYRQNFLAPANLTDEKCYLFDSESQNKPKTKSTKGSKDDKYLICTCDKFGDVLVGDFKSGLPGYAIALITIGSLAVAGVGGFLCWKFGVVAKVINFFKSFNKVEKPIKDNIKSSEPEVVEKRIEYSSRSKSLMNVTSKN